MDFNEWKKENIYKGESKTWVEWCELAFKAGQQSKQAEIDALKNKIQTALNKACMLQNSSGERIYTELKEALK